MITGSWNWVPRPPPFLIRAITLPIRFLSNGSIDHEWTNATELAQANATLQPTISALQIKYGQDLDFWQLTNWFFVSLYWTLLADFGQVTLVTIGDNLTVPLPQDNNIFTNHCSKFTPHISKVRFCLFWTRRIKFQNSPISTRIILSTRRTPRSPRATTADRGNGSQVWRF